jgi:hypothetical protein
MTDFSKPTVTDNYTASPGTMQATITDIARQFEPTATGTHTNVPTNMIRWNAANNYWEKYNGSAWAALTATYAISISGLAATATTAAACTGNAASATTAAACSGNAATATTAAACSGNAATATTLTGALATGLGGSGATTVTGTGNNVLSANPTLTGTLTAAAGTFSGALSGLTVTQTSDDRKKKNWRKLPSDFLQRLQLVKRGYFEWRGKKLPRQMGVRAQSLQAVLPEFVEVGADGFLSVNYGAAALLGVLELVDEVSDLRDELVKLKIQAARVKK